MSSIIPEKPIEFPVPKKHPEVIPPPEPGEPLPAEGDPEIIPWEEPFEPPPYEVPAPGEGP